MRQQKPGHQQIAVLILLDSFGIDAQKDAQVQNDPQIVVGRLKMYSK
jgi:hypothetical protein